MDKIGIKERINNLGRLGTEDMYLNDFLLTWDKSRDEIQAVFTVADILRGFRTNNISTRFFDSGLGLWSIHPVPWTDGGVIFDVDTPQLLREAQPSRSLQKGGGPLQEEENESS